MTWLTTLRRQNLPNEFNLFDQWMREFFEGNGQKAGLPEGRSMPRADIAETDKEFLVTLELPGINENEVDVRLVGNQLVVSGERKQKKEEKEKHWHRVETVYGAFERRFELPPEVRKDPETVKAVFSKGLLEVRIPKAEVRPAAKIPVKTA